MAGRWEYLRSGVQPAPVRIQRNLTSVCGTATRGARLERERGMDLRGLRANLLGMHYRKKRQREEGGTRKHCTL